MTYKPTANFNNRFFLDVINADFNKSYTFSIKYEEVHNLEKYHITLLLTQRFCKSDVNLTCVG